MNSVFRNPLVKALPYVLGFWILAFIVEACISKADDLSNKTVAINPVLSIHLSTVWSCSQCK
jgi:hypothetical protein